MSERWEITWAVGKRNPSTGRIEVDTEEDVEFVSRELQMHFYPQSNWNITARRMEGTKE